LSFTFPRKQIELFIHGDALSLHLAIETIFTNLNRLWSIYRKIGSIRDITIDIGLRINVNVDTSPNLLCRLAHCEKKVLL
jgi:hypothetical protein